LPSMMATHEFVVPRSMPMIRPIWFSCELLKLNLVLWSRCGWRCLIQGRNAVFAPIRPL